MEMDREVQASMLRGSLLEFNKFFYKHVTGRDFIVSQPHGRESHQITICRAYTDIFRTQKEAHGLVINVPPGYGKSILTCMWIAWCFSHYPDCNFLYISYSHDLAAKHTGFIKQIMTSPLYRYLFDISLSLESRAKDKFSTTAGGTVCAFGSTGSITGQNAGLPGLPRFSGAVCIDDAHKPDEIHSTSMRESVIRNYQETILQRPRDSRVPIVFIGQRLHEEDLGAYFLTGKDVRKWDSVILRGIDDAGNALYPEAQPIAYLRNLAEKQPYVFYSQIQQEPIPSGGALFKPDWFVMLEEEPDITNTFITVDTAETSKSYNDATAFSFWGVYEIESYGVKTGELGLHWIDTLECRIEPKDLKPTFLDFWQSCMGYKVPPRIVAIEKKSTGGTLLSLIDEIRTVRLMDIPRTKVGGNKTKRFLDCQPYVAERRVSLPLHGRHVKLCIDHMSKITANETHRFDDIADTLADAIRMALIEKTIKIMSKQGSHLSGSIMRQQKKMLKIQSDLYHG